MCRPSAVYALSSLLNPARIVTVKINYLPAHGKVAQQLCGADHVLLVEVGEGVVQNDEGAVLAEHVVHKCEAEAQRHYGALTAREVPVGAQLAAAFEGDGEIFVDVYLAAESAL